MVSCMIISSSADRHLVQHRTAPAERRIKRIPPPVAPRRIAHAARRLFASASCRSSEGRCRAPPMSIGAFGGVAGWISPADPRHQHAGLADATLIIACTEPRIDGPVLKVDEMIQSIPERAMVSAVFDARDRGDRAEVGRFSRHCWRRRLSGVAGAGVNCKTPLAGGEWKDSTW